VSKFNKIQTTFKAGEVSDKAKGRVDFEEYTQSCDRLENFIIQRQGGAVKRPGTRYEQDLISGSFLGERAVPFVFSKTESYIVVFNSFFPSLVPMRVFNTDGTEATVNYDDFINATSFANYDSKNWKYAQSGDILVLAYSEPTAVENTTILSAGNSIAPAFLIRTDDNEFDLVTFSHPQFLDKIPSRGKLNPAVNRPYLDPNTNPDIRLYLPTTTVGLGRAAFAVDSNNDPIPFFKLGHVFSETGGPSSAPTQVGGFFKVQSGSTEGVFYPTVWPNDLLESSADIDIATDVVTSIAHNLNTRDRVILAETGAPGTTDPVISGFPLTNSSYGKFYVRALTANTLAFYTSQADADADSNRIDFTDAGDKGIRIQHYELNKVTGNIEVEMPAGITSAAAASDNWQESAWSTEQGFPRAVVFHEQRLIFGGTKNRPDSIWASNVGNLFNFMARRLEQDTASPTPSTSTLSGQSFALSGDISATDPVGFTIASKQANIIQWMESQNVLLVGTIGAEYTVTGGDSIISNESIFVKKQTDYGSNNVQAISVGNSILFSSRDGRRIRNFKFNRDNGSYLSLNLNLLAEHIVFRGFDGAASSTLKGVEFREMHYQPSRDTVWCITSNDEVVALTFSKESQIAAWQYHKTRDGDKFQSLAVAPSATGRYDEVWASVERSVNGSTVRYLEKMGDDFEHDVLNNTSSNDDDTAWYVDSAVKVVLGSSTNIVTGLSHLEGESVDALAGNTVEKGLTVAGGQVTLGSTYPAGTVVVVGLRYKSRLRTLDIEAGGDFGTSQGNRQRIDEVRMRLYKSQGGSYGNPEQTSLFDFEYDDNEIVTEIRRLKFNITPNMDNQVLVEHDDPVPFNILSMTYRGVSYD